MTEWFHVGWEVWVIRMLYWLLCSDGLACLYMILVLNRRKTKFFFLLQLFLTSFALEDLRTVLLVMLYLPATSHLSQITWMGWTAVPLRLFRIVTAVAVALYVGGVTNGHRWYHFRRWLG